MTFGGDPGGTILGAIDAIGSGLASYDEYYEDCMSIRSTLMSMYYSGRLRYWNGFNDAGWNGATKVLGASTTSGVQPPYFGDSGLWAHEGYHAWAQSLDDDAASFYQSYCTQ
jgi:hypothetical protein